jgi:superfamily II DNA/RNA helicase
MLDMGFVPDIKFLISQLTDKKQTLFFSATMNPKAEEIANSLLKNPVKIQVEKEAPGKNVDQDIVKCKGEEKLSTLVEILQGDDVRKVLIFCRTKRGADKLSKQLYERKFRVGAIHGDKTQNKRLDVLQKFKKNTINILVATDVAARGLDIPNVTHVINYDEPENYKDYIHRIGRTGRAGKKGKSLTFVRK